MSRNETVIDAPREKVFRELLEPDSFAYWVVGSKIIRGADDDWPAEGSAFHHAVGVGPIHIEDHTRLLEVDEPRRVVMRALGRPLGSAIVRLLLEPEDGRTRVVMEEEPESGPGTWLPDRFIHLISGMRNAGSLRRLKRLIRHPGNAGELSSRSPTDTSAATGRSATDNSATTGRSATATSAATERFPVALAAAAAVGTAAVAAVLLLRRRRRRGG